MRDERRIIINPETDRKGEEGLAKVFGIVFWAVMLIGVLDHMLTVGWTLAESRWASGIAMLSF